MSAPAPFNNRDNTGRAWGKDLKRIGKNVEVVEQHAGRAAIMAA